jgi:hypothetical protein
MNPIEKYIIDSLPSLSEEGKEQALIVLGVSKKNKRFTTNKELQICSTTRKY